MALEVHVISARNLPNAERIGKSDPYVQLAFQGVKRKTDVKESTLDPTWDETLVWDFQGKPPSPDEILYVYVKDYERLGRNRLLGEATIFLRNLIQSVQPETNVDYELSLVDKNQRPTPAKLMLRVSYKVLQAKHKATAKSAAVQDPKDKTPAASTQGAGDQLLPSGVSDVYDSESTPAVQGVPSTSYGQGRRPRDLLPNKEIKFQIRIKVVEAHQLLGGDLNPVCQVKLLSESKQTNVCKSTASPWFNKIFFFYATKYPSDILEQVVEFQVCDSKVLRSDTLIGAFRCDLGNVYDNEEHAFVNKWLVLSNPEENLSGVMGYLKVCIAVLAPGDECPVFKESEAATDDVESNLLLPAGVQLQPATFILHVYEAQDLPRMDTGAMQGVKKVLGIGEVSKELVDPYIIFSFAGKEVQSKVMYTVDSPEFRETLYLGFHFPSICNNITLTVKDWDRLTEDDTIGTTFISLPHTSTAGENGFLPTFGPSFVTIYGSTREFSPLAKDYEEDLNTGKIEGCAFRGRVLVELKTTVGEYPNIPTSPIPLEDALKVEKFCRRRRYLLHTAFLSASMVSEVDVPLEFEISMGNYGNKFEDSVMPCPSTTQPTNAVFDGCSYYFLPWEDSKPFVTVNCQWEDISFRLQGLNFLLAMVESLEKSLEALRKFTSAGKSKAEQAVQFVQMIDRLIMDCRVRLPEPQPGCEVANQLDNLLRKVRQQELENISQEALVLREQATDIQKAITNVEGFLGRLQKLAVEPQNSMPDIIIWMMSGKKRISYCRLPAHTVLYAEEPRCCGKMFGKLQSLQMKYPGLKKSSKIPALLRIQVWLGQEVEEQKWMKPQNDSEQTVFAETYENQVNVLGKWITRGPTMTRPNFSDASGNMSLPMEKFESPTGWRFEGDWFVSPEPSMMYDADAGHQVFLEDVFENQNRLPGGNWIPAITTWTDVRGDPAMPRDEVQCPEGWQWDDVWKVDLKRAVDEEGWEYTIESTLGGYGPVEKVYHLCRRRRWVRMRRVDLSVAKKQKEEEDLEGWEFAPIFGMKFHARERKMDFVRRRRWHRKMVADGSAAQPVPVFNFGIQEGKDDTSTCLQMTVPKMYLVYTQVHKYQLRAYIYQARDLPAGDKTGFSDPYACVCLLNQSQQTERLQQTLCPTWDQTLIFNEIVIHGDPLSVQDQPPEVVIELFDHDAYGEPEFLGRTSVSPVTHMDSSSARLPHLAWYPLQRGQTRGGELLAAFELYLKDENVLPFLPPKRGDLFIVPSGIRPELQRTAVEVLCWGLRNMKTFELSKVSHPSVEFECAGTVVESTVISDMKNYPNFEKPLLFFDILLPKEDLYMPPMNIKVRDHRAFGNKPVVGTSVISSLHTYRCEPLTSSAVGEPATTQGDTIIDVKHEEDKVTMAKVDTDIDWWAKYYASLGDEQKSGNYLQKGYENLQVYPFELEKVKSFHGFTDFLTTFPLKRGKSKEMEESDIIGEFKGTLRVYPLPGDPTAAVPPPQLRGIPTSTVEEILVRVYVVRGVDLAPRDANGLADPYVQLTIGKLKKDSKADFRANTLNPIFGHMFELNAVLPTEKDLKIAIFDKDAIGNDDLIGETSVDLENRHLTKFRATCGLPRQYHSSGPNQWRDTQKPRKILSSVCETHNFPSPKWAGQSEVTIGSKIFRIQDFENEASVHPPSLGCTDERLALHVLNTMGLVPEHVETRSLYNPSMPGLDQGKIEMWIDIFPKSAGTPSCAFDVTPRKPNKYVLRCVVYNVYNVHLQESNIAGEQMSDVYVKGWLKGTKLMHTTDVHYRCLDGEANFNWRFVFPMEYLESEHQLVIRKKEHFWSQDETEEHRPPILTMQIWDNDIISADDYLGEINLNLANLVKPAKNVDKCSLAQIAVDSREDNGQAGIVNLAINVDEVSAAGRIDLFEKRRAYGFWPCVTVVDGQKQVGGKIEMEVEVLTEEEAKSQPAGVGREEPNMNPKLEEPQRPATSFFWLASPWKSFRHVLWKNYKWYIITFIVLLIFVLFIIIFFYSVPGSAVNLIFKTY